MNASKGQSTDHQWPDIDAFVLSSAHLRQELKLSMAHLPASGTARRHLTAYVLDPAFNFSAAVAIADFLTRFAALARGSWPEVTVVGVGYDTSDSRTVMSRRATDLTPTPSAPPPGVRFPPVSFGGAPRFLGALLDDVRPAVDKRVAKASVRVLVGHSFGGLFGLYTLFHQPESFDGYLLISPSLWWDDRIVFRYEQAWSETKKALRVPLFLAAGEGEQAAGAGWRNEGFPDEAIQAVREVDNVKELAAVLRSRQYDGFQLRTAVIPDEYHLTVFPSAFNQGLRWMTDQLVG